MPLLLLRVEYIINGSKPIAGKSNPSITNVSFLWQIVPGLKTFQTAVTSLLMYFSGEGLTRNLTSGKLVLFKL